MRVINADVLQDLMYHEAFEVDSDMQKWDGGCWIRYKVFENCLAKTPTLKEHCKTGKWLLDEERSKEHVEHIYICSACHNNEAWGETERTRYCSYCGAEMENWT